MRGKPVKYDSARIEGLNEQSVVAITPTTGIIHQAAKSMLALSISVIPAQNKMPTVKAWNPFRQKRMEMSQVESYFNGSPEIAILGGGASGGLEIIDIDLKYDDSGTLFDDFSHLVSDADEELWNSLVMQFTRGGGVHILYRCAMVEGNKKLASRPASEAERARNPDERVKVLIETRGEGGYVIAAPSPGYRLFSGHDFAQIPTITPEQRDLLFAAARSMNRYVPEAGQAADPTMAGPAKTGFSKRESEEWEITPGDDFDARADVLELLVKHGWSIVMERGEKVWLKRPGDTTAAHSANWNVIPGRFWCWSTSTQFEAGTVYKPYAVYAWLEHNGNFKEAIKALIALGYGKRKENFSAGKQFFGQLKTEQNQDFSPDNITETQITELMHESELGLGKLFALCHGHQYIHDKEYREWRTYQNGVWRLDKEKRVFAKSADHLKVQIRKPLATVEKQVAAAQNKESAEHLNKRRDTILKIIYSLNKRSTVANLLAFAEGMVTTLATDLDKNPYAFNLRNGTIHLATGAFSSHDPKDLLSKKAPYTYSQNTACPQWESFLSDIFQQDAELIAFVQKAVGYSLTGLSDMQALFFCYGNGGNGKTIFFSVLQALMGDYYQNIPIDLLIARERSNTDEYQMANLRAARCVVASEIPEGKKMNESQVKDLTGGDPINARVPHGMPFTFQPTHTLWMFGNHKPVINGTDQGIWRRIHLVPFLYTIPPEKRKDKNLLMNAFNDEMPGIFNWALQGFHDYLEHGLEKPAAVSQATQEYRDESNNFTRFLEEQCHTGCAGSVPAKILFKSYLDWCGAENEKAKFFNVKQMNEFLRSQGYEVLKSTGGIFSVFKMMLKPFEPVL